MRNIDATGQEVDWRVGDRVRHLRQGAVGVITAIHGEVSGDRGIRVQWKEPHGPIPPPLVYTRQVVKVAP